MNRWGCLILALSIAVLPGCNYTKTVTFGTSTMYGLNVDTEPTPTLNIGLDRTELLIGPRYKNGAVPPVVANIKAEGGLFSAGVSQIYATGDAAKIATSNQEPGSDKQLKGDREMMFFGTNTNLGIKASFVGNTPKSFNFGYKREELSIIPVGIEGGDNGVDTYASVLAKINTTAQVKDANKNFMEYEAFFATGTAAENFAKNPAVRGAFEKVASDAYAAYGADKNSKLLRKFWKPDGKSIDQTNQTALTGWMTNHGLSTQAGDITLFLSNEMFAHARAQAVRDLDLQNK